MNVRTHYEQVDLLMNETQVDETTETRKANI